MSTWFIEWESGNTEVVRVSGNKAARGNRDEAWPVEFPSAVLSAVRMPEAKVQDFNRMASNLQNLGIGGFGQNQAAQNNQNFRMYQDYSQ